MVPSLLAMTPQPDRVFGFYDDHLPVLVSPISQHAVEPGSSKAQRCGRVVRSSNPNWRPPVMRRNSDMFVKLRYGTIAVWRCSRHGILLDAIEGFARERLDRTVPPGCFWQPAEHTHRPFWLGWVFGMRVLVRNRERFPHPVFAHVAKRPGVRRFDGHQSTVSH